MKSTPHTKLIELIFDLNAEALADLPIENLSAAQIDECLKLADKAVISEIQRVATGIDKVPADKVAEHVSALDSMLMHYFAVRALINEANQADDDQHGLKIF